jgi:hypothetical protein
MTSLSFIEGKDFFEVWRRSSIDYNGISCSSLSTLSAIILLLALLYYYSFVSTLSAFLFCKRMMMDSKIEELKDWS